MNMLMRTDPFRELDRVKAEYDAGVLRLTIPVSEKAKPRGIDIASNGHSQAIES